MVENCPATANSTANAKRFWIRLFHQNKHITLFTVFIKIRGYALSKDKTFSELMQLFFKTNWFRFDFESLVKGGFRKDASGNCWTSVSTGSIQTRGFSYFSLCIFYWNHLLFDWIDQFWAQGLHLLNAILTILSSLMNSLFEYIAYLRDFLLTAKRNDQTWDVLLWILNDLLNDSNLKKIELFFTEIECWAFPMRWTIYYLFDLETGPRVAAI